MCAGTYLHNWDLREQALHVEHLRPRGLCFVREAREEEAPLVEEGAVGADEGAQLPREAARVVLEVAQVVEEVREPFVKSLAKEPPALPQELVKEDERLRDDDAVRALEQARLEERHEILLALRGLDGRRPQQRLHVLVLGWPIVVVRRLHKRDVDLRATQVSRASGKNGRRGRTQ